jgi:hypothetical protein
MGEMGDEILRQIEVSLLSALLKSGILARDLAKAGFRPNLLPSPEGQDLAQVILRLRDSRGDVTEDVEAQVAAMASRRATVAALLAVARDASCPYREQALAHLALLELCETSRLLRVVQTEADRLLGGSPAPPENTRAPAHPRRAVPARYRRVHMADPANPVPGELRKPGDPAAD